MVAHMVYMYMLEEYMYPVPWYLCTLHVFTNFKLHFGSIITKLL